MISWMYAHRFGELPSGEAERVEALVRIAEELNALRELLDKFISIHYEK